MQVSRLRWVAVAVFGVLGLVGVRELRRDELVAPAKVPAVRAESTVAPRTPTAKSMIGYEEARPILARSGMDLPPELAGRSERETSDMWAGWTMRHDIAIRSRVLRGEEDSIVNLWLYGTSFTDVPRVTDDNVVRLSESKPATDVRTEILDARLSDLVDGVVNPGGNERLLFARHVLERNGIEFAGPSGREQARLQLIRWGMSSASQANRHQQKMEAARALPDQDRQLSILATLYQDRGLAPDTSVYVGNSIERVLSAHRDKGLLRAGQVHRVGVIGPGLDFIDKLEGYDFYPQQSLQPFALLDSLHRLGLAASGVNLTTFDINPRINAHLESARFRAREGDGYALQLPLTQSRRGHVRHPDVLGYWERLGTTIGDEGPPLLPTGEAAEVRMRAVRVRPAVVASIKPVDLNVVLERSELPLADRLDLVIATNVLVYYTDFEQSLALANLAHMVRPGGLVVTNYPIPPSPAFGSSALFVMTVPWDHPPSQDGDTLYTYRRH